METYNLSGQIIPTFLLASPCTNLWERCFTCCSLLYFSPIVNYICSWSNLAPLLEVQKLFPVFCCTGAARRYTSKFRKLFSWMLLSVLVPFRIKDKQTSQNHKPPLSWKNMRHGFSLGYISFCWQMLTCWQIKGITTTTIASPRVLFFQRFVVLKTLEIGRCFTRKPNKIP